MPGTLDLTGEARLPERETSGAPRQGRYVLGELLGSGGMAEVFAGESMGSHGFRKPVAIKRLLPELANDRVFVERLIGEAKLLVGMTHGNVVSVIDLARDGGDVFLVMEFVDGPSVRQLLGARGARGLPIGVATYIVQMAATGLEFAHGRPGGAVIHADISPSNILLTTSGEVRVADFGIARREGKGAGVVEGKWAYMAPEQARGEALTPRSDVFALGVVLYELICGQHPLGRQVTADERERAALYVIPPRQIAPGIPAGIEAICMRALAHDPRDRYASMQKLIDALGEERFANGWREGANDLAAVIREVSAGDAPAASPKTQQTNRPITIVTRSLIIPAGFGREIGPLASFVLPPPHSFPPPELAPPAIAPPAIDPPVLAEHHVDQDPPPEPGDSADIGARTTMRFISPIDPMSRPAPPPPPAPPPAPASMEIPHALQHQLLAMAASMLPPPELASVHGGNAFAGHSVAMERPSLSRWALGVLGAAALAGAITAVAIEVRSNEDEVRPLIALKPPATPVVNKLDLDHPVPPRAPAQVPAPAPAPAPAPRTLPAEVVPAVTPPPPTDKSTDKSTDKPTDKSTDKPTDNTSTDKPSDKPIDKPTDKPVDEPRHPDNSTTVETRIAAHRAHAARPKLAKADAFIQVDEWNGEYAQASIGDQVHDGLPAKFYVPAGNYTLHLQNDRIRFACRVTLAPGKALHVHVSLENRSCADH